MTGSASPRAWSSDLAVDRTWARWLSLAALALVLIAVWQVPWLGWLVYPFRLFGTFIHELSHGLAAMVTGGEFLRFRVEPDLSGVATSAGGWRWVVASAGYVGSAVFGGLLLAIHARLLGARALLIGLAVMFAVLCLLFLRNLFGVAAALGLTAALLLAGLKLPATARSWLVDILALQLILDGYGSLFTVFLLSSSEQVRTDAHTMAAMSWLPASAWAVIWALLSTFVLALSVKIAVSGRRAP
ncbi:MAG: M50 family metallopeptidase [Ahniella sp.]|nr:M50 family metallopeptidase [Ahniella sp.]